MAIGGLVQRLRALAFALWSRTSRRIRVLGAMVMFFILALYLSGPVSRKLDVTVPKVRFDYKKNHSPFNETKVALLIENRPNPILAPLMLHFISVVPPDWRFRFMGSIESVEWLNRSVAIQEQVSAGKLDLTYIPSNMTTGSQEEISRFLTTLWLYETVLQPAEHLLVFQTDSILCANSRKNLNDFLEYDWIGAPWNPEGRFGGNGGLSIRRVSAMIQVLREQKRVDGTEPEDVWLADRLGHRPGAKMANGTASLTFSGEMWGGKGAEVTDGKSKGYNSTYTAALDGEFVEGIDDWRKGFYEPMGYHTGASGATTHGPIWGTPEMRKHIWDYCPEVKMTLKMDAAKYIPGDCGPYWKRGDGELADAVVSDVDMGWGTEIIDGQEYPMLPPNLMPW
ncbi:hypothetical protein GGTG_10073 [Gaeumannomyces tritici R3-111a-1]|uniref:DUF5672 domain-containing protein n=1 Tax=Gaeumannomyces tritici (strain R3-111a-1) TaxID=644352 RepID=J3P990_GAET3|nr:hypothetical protein GGTG_10073 [Gaeumannomyces tritici R3-111a-1]EJT73226.1 hypothetical protein GGTG_10073 [Gaeumannomyces tritici R3-111a-1]